MWEHHICQTHREYRRKNKRLIATKMPSACFPSFACTICLKKLFNSLKRNVIPRFLSPQRSEQETTRSMKIHETNLYQTRPLSRLYSYPTFMWLPPSCDLPRGIALCQARQGQRSFRPFIAVALLWLVESCVAPSESGYPWGSHDGYKR